MAEIRIRFTIENERALTALCEAAEILEELQEDFPWREEPERAAKCFRYAAEHLRARQTRLDSANGPRDGTVRKSGF